MDQASGIVPVVRAAGAVDVDIQFGLGQHAAPIQHDDRLIGDDARLPCAIGLGLRCIGHHESAQERDSRPECSSEHGILQPVNLSVFQSTIFARTAMVREDFTRRSGLSRAKRWRRPRSGRWWRGSGLAARRPRRGRAAGRESRGPLEHPERAKRGWWRESGTRARRASREAAPPEKLEAPLEQPRTSEASDWCERGDSNPHGIATASPSSWCVCQFRHFREEGGHPGSPHRGGAPEAEPAFWHAPGRRPSQPRRPKR